MSDIDPIPGLRDIEYRQGHKLDLRPMNPDRTSSAIPTRDEMMDWTAVQLLGGHPVRVELQPGDATLYDFYLIPMWGQGLRPRYLSEQDAMKYMLLAQYNLEQRTVLVPFSRDDNEVYFSLSELIRNEWTVQLLSCFILHLADAAHKISGRKQHAEVSS